MSRKLDNAPVTQNIWYGCESPRFAPALFKIIRAGCIVMKIPINNTATSWIAPHVKWFCTLTSFGVVLNERNAAKSISTISIIDGTDSLTSPKIGNESTSPAAFWNTESPGSTPLNITAITISTINKKLCAPFILIRGSPSLISGIRPIAISFWYAFLSRK